MKIEIGENYDGSFSLTAGLEIGVGLGDVDPRVENKFDVHLLAPKISLAQLKVNEATYFLRRLKLHLGDEAATHYHFNGFVAALYSLPEVLQKEGHGKQGFREWLLAKKMELHENADFNRLVRLRDQSTHGGIHPPNLAFGILFREYLDGRRTMEPSLDMIALGGTELPNPMEGMDRALAAAAAVVKDGSEKGFVERRLKKGHTMRLSFAKEVEGGGWREASQSEMAMFDPKKNKPMRKAGGFRPGIPRRRKVTPKDR